MRWVKRRKSALRFFSVKLLDTSVLVDTRFVEYMKFYLEGLVIIPSFVLREAHIMSDSKDALVRQKGKTALENACEVSKWSNVLVVNAQFKERSVDYCLLECAKLLKKYLITDVAVVTGDSNLSHLLHMHDIKCFNTNAMFFHMRKMFFPKQELEVKIVHSGEKMHQGVGYASDGTMIVVENTSDMIGKTVVAEVRNLKNSPVGRMVFCQFVRDISSE